jgi:hypothetical protein
MTSFQVVVLAAGTNNFLSSGIATSKINIPLTFDGLTLLDACLLEVEESTKTVCVVNPEDFNLASEIASKYPQVTVKGINYPTSGALVSLAICLGELDPNLPILVTSVDGLVPTRISQFVMEMKASKHDGGAIVMAANDPQLSYVIKAGDAPIEFVEKRVVSNLATTGVFYFSNRELLAESIEWVLVSKTSLEKNYYISSALNRLIFDNKSIGLFEVSPSEYMRFSNPNEYNLSKPIYERCRNAKR